jgi:hypothetical protein
VKAVCKQVVLFGLIVAALGGCDQPKPNCLTSLTPFVMKLLEDKSKPTAQEESVPGACAAANATLESFYADPLVGLSPYYVRDEKGQPDYNKGSVAIRTAELANLVDTAASHDVEASTDTVLHSIGSFSGKEPDGNDVCTAPTLSATRVVVPAVPPKMDDPTTAMKNERFAGQPAVDATLTWSNVKIYVTADSFGTQVEAFLKDVRVAPGGGGTCTRYYRGLGLSPAVPCYQTDEDHHPLTNPDGTYQIDPTLCNPEPDPSMMRYAGSGIGPSARTICDPTIGHCVLEGETFPALK